jgi:hypothetical protein
MRPRIFGNPLLLWLLAGLPGLLLVRAMGEGGGVTVRRGVRPINIVSAGITAGVCAVLALFAIIIIPIPGIPGGSGFWIPAGFYFAFTLWFGIWGAIGAHIATTIAMGYFLGYTLVVWADGGIGDFLGPLVILIIFRSLKADPELKTPRDMRIWIIGVVIANIIVAAWVHSINALFGVIPWEYWPVGFIAYLIGDTAAVLIISTPLLKTLTKHVKQTPAYVEGYIS